MTIMNVSAPTPNHVTPFIAVRSIFQNRLR
jgi:hypothetical protein